jgi:hypothetical protein
MLDSTAAAGHHAAGQQNKIVLVHVHDHHHTVCLAPLKRGERLPACHSVA